MTEHAAGLPESWDITPVEITETTTYRVPVAHPRTATPHDIAAVGYDDYHQQEHPETAFPHDPGADQVTVAGEQRDTAGWPDWAAQRPDHDTVVAILEAGRGDPERAA